VKGDCGCVARECRVLRAAQVQEVAIIADAHVMCVPRLDRAGRRVFKPDDHHHIVVRGSDLPRVSDVLDALSSER
jgi:hypothetical protein